MPAVEPSGTFRFQIRKKKCFNRFSAFQHHLVSSFFLLLRVHIKPWSFIFQISQLLVSTVYGKSRQQNLNEKMFNRTKTTKNNLLGWMNHTSVFTTTEKRNDWAEFSWEKKKNIFWEKKKIGLQTTDKCCCWRYFSFRNWSITYIWKIKRTFLSVLI